MDLKYSLIGPIVSDQASRIIRFIHNSKKVEIANELPDGRLSHIVIKGTKTPVGYLGNETLEKVNPKDESLKPYHAFLEEVYRLIIKMPSFPIKILP
ncbi:MAG: hypothetical protein ABIH28_01260 [archaeon]